MRNFLLLFLTLVLTMNSVFASSATGRVIEADEVVGIVTKRNYIKNADAEKNVNYVSGTATIERETASPIKGKGSFKITFSGSDYVDFEVNPLDIYSEGEICYLKFSAVSSASGNLSAQLRQDGSDLGPAVSIPAVAGERYSKSVRLGACGTVSGERVIRVSSDVSTVAKVDSLEMAIVDEPIFKNALDLGNTDQIQGILSYDKGGTGLNAVGASGNVLMSDGSQWYSAPLPEASASISSINGLTSSSQTFVFGSSGTDVNIDSTGGTHTFNIPFASATSSGKLSAADWATFNGKADAGSYVTTLTGDVTSSGFSGGSVTTTIADGVITSSKLAVDSVHSFNIQADTIIADDIAANAVTSSELANDAVSTAKIQDGAVDLGTKVSGVLAPANGGTGLATSGTAGNVLTSNGSGGWTSTAPTNYQTAIDAVKNTPTQQIMYVAKSGNDSTGTGSVNNPYLTVKAAQDAITDATSAKRYAILIGPGTYSEASGWAPKQFVSYVGIGSRSSTILQSTGDMNMSLTGASPRVNFTNIFLQANGGVINVDATGATTTGLVITDYSFINSVMNISANNTVNLQHQVRYSTIGAVNTSGFVSSFLYNDVLNGNYTQGSASATVPQGSISIINSVGPAGGSLNANAASVTQVGSYFDVVNLNDKGLYVTGTTPFFHGYTVDSLPAKSAVTYTGTHWTKAPFNAAHALGYDDSVTALGGAGEVTNVQQAIETMVAQIDAELPTYLKRDGSNSVTGVIKPATNNTTDLGANGNSFGSVYAGKIRSANGEIAVDNVAHTLNDGSGNQIIDFFGPSISVTSKKITNLADGSASNDAVNKSQLDAVLAKIFPAIFGTRSAPRNVQTGGITVSGSHMNTTSASEDIYVCGSSDGSACNSSVTLSTIDDGGFDGQRMCIIGRSATNTVSITTSTTNVKLNGDATLALDDTLCLRHDGSDWVEVSRNF